MKFQQMVSVPGISGLAFGQYCSLINQFKNGAHGGGRRYNLRYNVLS